MDNASLTVKVTVPQTHQFTHAEPTDAQGHDRGSIGSSGISEGAKLVEGEEPHLGPLHRVRASLTWLISECAAHPVTITRRRWSCSRWWSESVLIMGCVVSRPVILVTKLSGAVVGFWCFR